MSKQAPVDNENCMSPEEFIAGWKAHGGGVGREAEGLDADIRWSVANGLMTQDRLKQIEAGLSFEEAKKFIDLVTMASSQKRTPISPPDGEATDALVQVFGIVMSGPVDHMKAAEESEEFMEGLLKALDDLNPEFGFVDVLFCGHSAHPLDALYVDPSDLYSLMGQMVDLSNQPDLIEEITDSYDKAVQEMSDPIEVPEDGQLVDARIIIGTRLVHGIAERPEDIVSSLEAWGDAVQPFAEEFGVVIAEPDIWRNIRLRTCVTYINDQVATIVGMELEEGARLSSDDLVLHCAADTKDVHFAVLSKEGRMFGRFKIPAFLPAYDTNDLIDVLHGVYEFHIHEDVEGLPAVRRLQ